MSASNIVKCPGCQAEYDGAGYEPGDRFECPSCQEIVTVGGSVAPQAAAPKMAKMHPRGGTTRRTASRAPSVRERGTAKMKVVGEAVGMGALNPGVDPRAIRRAGAPAPVPQEGPDKTMMIVGVVVAAVVILGALIYILKQPSAEDKKKSKLEAAREAQEKQNKEDDAKKAAAKAANPGGTSENPGGQKDPLDASQAVVDDVSGVCVLLKGKPEDAVFLKIAVKLVKYGKEAVPPLIDKIGDDDREIALAAGAILHRLTRWFLPPDYFNDSTMRKTFAAELRAQWIKSGATITLPTEEQFLADAGGGTATTNPPTNPDPTKPPSGVTEPRKVGGGTSEAALRQNLPQHIANYATGTYDQRQETIAEVRKYGKPVIAALIGALKEEDPARANAAYDMLKEFTKQDFGRLPGEPGDRAPFIQKWTDWWKGAEASFSM